MDCRATGGGAQAACILPSPVRKRAHMKTGTATCLAAGLGLGMIALAVVRGQQAGAGRRTQVLGPGRQIDRFQTGRRQTDQQIEEGASHDFGLGFQQAGRTRRSGPNVEARAQRRRVAQAAHPRAVQDRRAKGTELPFCGTLLAIKRKVFIPASAAVCRCSRPIPSSTRAPAGPASSARSPRATSSNIATGMGSVAKFSAAAATVTWETGRFSTRGPAHRPSVLPEQRVARVHGEGQAGRAGDPRGRQQASGQVERVISRRQSRQSGYRRGRIAAMSQEIEAIYEGGVFRPLGRIDLPEQTKVCLQIQPVE